MSSVVDRGAARSRWNWLLFSFARREVLNRYAGSVTGLAWSLLHPLMQLAVYAFVFNQVFRISVPPEFSTASYTAFVAVALWPWIMFSEGLQRAMASVAANAGLIRKVAFPHTLVVYSAILASCAVHGVGFIAVLVVLKAVGQPIHLAALPLAIVLLVPYMLFATGIGALLAALQTLLRDIEHAITIVLTILFYASPILYSASLVPQSLRPWLAANPVAWFSERLRDVLLHGDGLSAGDAAMTVAAIAVFVAGRWVFLRLSPHFEDFL
ncbi:MAG: ABC transporter permease [Bacillota bacterium]